MYSFAASKWQRSIPGSLTVKFIKRVGQPDQTGEVGIASAFQAIRVADPSYRSWWWRMISLTAGGKASDWTI